MPITGKNTDKYFAIVQSALPNDNWTLAKITTLAKNAHVTESENGFLLYRCMYDVCEILLIAVLPQVQKTGTGQALLQKMEQNLSDEVQRIVLEVAVDNQNAIAFYSKNGFVKTGIRNKYYTRCNGQKTDALLLEKHTDICK